MVALRAEAELILAHPALGLALLDLSAGAGPDPVALLRARLTGIGFGAAFPGVLPIVHRVLSEQDLWRLPLILDHAFAARPTIGQRGQGWITALQATYLPPAVEPQPVAEPVAEARPAREAMPTLQDPSPEIAAPPTAARSRRLLVPICSVAALALGLGAALLQVAGGAQAPSPAIPGGASQVAHQAPQQAIPDPSAEGETGSSGEADLAMAALIAPGAEPEGAAETGLAEAPAYPRLSEEPDPSATAEDRAIDPPPSDPAPAEAEARPALPGRAMAAAETQPDRAAEPPAPGPAKASKPEMARSKSADIRESEAAPPPVPPMAHREAPGESAPQAQTPATPPAPPPVVEAAPIPVAPVEAVPTPSAASAMTAAPAPARTPAEPGDDATDPPAPLADAAPPSLIAPWLPPAEVPPPAVAQAAAEDGTEAPAPSAGSAPAAPVPPQVEAPAPPLATTQAPPGQDAAEVPLHLPDAAPPSPAAPWLPPAEAPAQAVPQVAPGPDIAAPSPSPAPASPAAPAVTQAATGRDAAEPSAPATAARPPVAATPAMDPRVVAMLVTRGEEMMARGDISAARLLFARAAASGSAAAATAMGRSFDPEVLRQLSVRGIRPDAEQAAQWYRRAAELGARP
ncbi:hypothetical protein [Falsiroseomonas tokyonensis]|uniref:Sel1 repeat family protein n=1 Tax=Falsiroseomonas tokyonensis TaxID=430521 RepID=A0ABV7BXN6_9PROT|nr:hypothetical protein [Falsiroseomonas tokyonensis]MBU8540429.1 hypothetical protein [Falsiroseomonas tokyonensis]